MIFRRFERLPLRRTLHLAAGAALLIAAAAVVLWRPWEPGRNGPSYLAEAEQAIGKGDLPAAVVTLRNAARAIPDNPNIRLRVAEVYLKMEMFASAEGWAWLARGTGADENRVAPLLAFAMLQQNKLSAVIKMVPTGTRDPAAEADVRVSLALAHLYLGNANVAAQLLDDARLRDPTTPRLPIGMARLALVRGDVAGAQAQLDTALSVDQASPEVVRLKSDVLRVKGDLAGALVPLSEALARHPDDVAMLVARADLYIAKDDLANAKQDVDRALAIAPQSLTPNFLRALLVARSGDYRKADEMVVAMSQFFSSLPAGYYLQGVVKYAIGQYMIAEDSLTRYLGHQPGDPGALRLLALIAMHNRDWAHAIALLQPVTDTDPSDSGVVSVLAEAYLGAGRKDEAVELYERAANAKPHDVERQTNAALMQVRYGDAGAGFAALGKIADTDAGLGVAGPVVVINDLRNGDVTKAAVTAEAMVQRDGDNLVLQNMLGGVRLAQFRFPEAERIFRTIIDKDPSFLAARRNLARTYLAMSRPERAQSVYEEVLRRQPNDLASLYALADLAAATNAIDAAVQRLQEAGVAAPQSPEPTYRLVQLYAKRKDWSQARTAASGLVARFPRDPQVVDLAASVRADSGDAAGAVEQFFALTQWFPRSAGIVQRFAEYQAKSGDTNGARKSLQQALILEPDNAPAMTNLVRLDFASGGADAALATALSFTTAQPVVSDLLAADVQVRAKRSDEAIGILVRGQALHPATELVVRLAELTYANAHPAEAEHMLQDWLKAHDDAVAARLALANFRMLAKDYDGAQALYERAAAQAPINVIALNNLAWLYARRHDPRANDLAQRAFHLAPDGMTADTLGWTFVSAGDPKAGLPFLETAGAALGQDMSVQYHLALALEATGDKRQARTLLERVVASRDAFDGKDDAKRRLEDLRHQ